MSSPSTVSSPKVHAYDLTEEQRGWVLEPMMHLEILIVDTDAVKDIVSTHAAWRVVFAEGHDGFGVGARVSMEISHEQKFWSSSGSETGTGTSSSNGPELHDGAFEVRPLRYTLDSRSAKEVFRYPIKENTTLGELVDVALDANMNAFSFILDRERHKLKGCRDFIMQYFCQLVRKGIIIEPAQKPWPVFDQLAKTYHETRGPDYSPIQKGQFRYYRRVHLEGMHYA